MLKSKISLLLFAVLITRAVIANEDVVMTANDNNVHFTSIFSPSESEVGSKLDIFVDLVKKLNHLKNYKEEILIDVSTFVGMRNPLDTMIYSVSYGNFEYRMYDKRCDTCEYGYDHNIYHSTGLIIKIRDRDFKVKEWLQLINSAVQNINLIKQNQKSYHIQNGKKWCTSFDDIKIPYRYANEFSLRADQAINDLLKEKEYCTSIRVFCNEIYYYQNQKFHFIHFHDTTQVGTSPSGTYRRFTPSKELDTLRSFLIADNVIHIERIYWGDFIYTSDSVLYFMDAHSKQTKGPFYINNSPGLIVYFAKYDHTEAPLNYFTITFQNYHHKSGVEKIIFSPDSNLLISNYDSLETELVKQFIRKKQPQTGLSFLHDKKNLLICLLISMAIILTITFLKRSK